MAMMVAMAMVTMMAMVMAMVMAVVMAMMTMTMVVVPLLPWRFVEDGHILLLLLPRRRGARGRHRSAKRSRHHVCPTGGRSRLWRWHGTAKWPGHHVCPAGGRPRLLWRRIWCPGRGNLCQTRAGGRSRRPCCRCLLPALLGGLLRCLLRLPLARTGLLLLLGQFRHWSSPVLADPVDGILLAAFVIEHCPREFVIAKYILHLLLYTVLLAARADKNSSSLKEFRVVALLSVGLVVLLVRLVVFFVGLVVLGSGLALLLRRLARLLPAVDKSGLGQHVLASGRTFGQHLGHTSMASGTDICVGEFSGG